LFAQHIEKQIGPKAKPVVITTGFFIRVKSFLEKSKCLATAPSDTKPP
jgi:hypothetical protein